MTTQNDKIGNDYTEGQDEKKQQNKSQEACAMLRRLNKDPIMAQNEQFLYDSSFLHNSENTFYKWCTYVFSNPNVFDSCEL